MMEKLAERTDFYRREMVKELANEIANEVAKRI